MSSVKLSWRSFTRVVGALSVTWLAFVPAARAASAPKLNQPCSKVDSRSGSFACVNLAKKGQRPKLRWSAVAPTAAAPAAPAAGTAASTTVPKQQTLVIYSGRTYGFEDVLKKYEKDSGVKLEVVTASDTANRERLRSEGSNSPADLYITTDVGALTTAANSGLLAPVKSAVLTQAIPAGLRDSGDRWFALSRRARVVYVNTLRVKPEDFPRRYEDLANEKWSGRLCLRPASHVYTQSLAANMMARIGTGPAATALKGIARNAKSENFIDSDTKIIETVNAGGCDAAIANTYYYPRLGVAKVPNVKLIFPNQSDDDRGAHVNISGAAVVATSSNKVLAQKFIEWMATTGQTDFANGNNEYPANSSVQPNEALQALGTFKADQGAILEYARLQPSAVVVLADSGWR